MPPTAAFSVHLGPAFAKIASVKFILRSTSFTLEKFGRYVQCHVMLFICAIYRAFSCDVITFKITKENKTAASVQDRSFYGDLHKMSDILIMLLIRVESDKNHCYIS